MAPRISRERGSREDTAPSFRAKARRAVVEESPSSRTNGSLSGRLRFLDSLRSLGMTTTESILDDSLTKLAWSRAGIYATASASPESDALSLI
jgi:hypothetical protein